MMDKITWIISSVFVIVLMQRYNIKDKYKVIFFIGSLLFIFKGSYIEILIFFVQIILPTALIIVAGYYITKYKMMMHGGSYSSRGYSFNYEKENKSEYKDEKKQRKNVNSNYGEGTLKECYDELGVDFNVSDDVLKKNHKKLARMYHPDMNQDKSEKEIKIMEDKFKRINEAYENIKKYRGI
jgi:hypothetical protein